jgi:hypothetical protein
MASVTTVVADELWVSVRVVPVVVPGAAVVLGVELVGVASGTNGLASGLRPDPAVTTEMGLSDSVPSKGEGLNKEVAVGGRSELHLEGATVGVITEVCEAGTKVSGGVVFVAGAVAREGVVVMGVVVWEPGVEAGGVWRTESRKEKVWETGLRLSPDNNARLSPTSAGLLSLPAPLAAELRLASTLPTDENEEFLASSVILTPLADAPKSSTHMGS